MTLSASKYSPLTWILNSLTVKLALEKRLSKEAWTLQECKDILMQVALNGEVRPPFHVFSLKS